MCVRIVVWLFCCQQGPVLVGGHREHWERSSSSHSLLLQYMYHHIYSPLNLLFTPADHVVQRDAHPTLVPNLIFAAIQYKCHWFCINHQVSLNYLITVVYFHRNLLIQCNNFNINGLREASKYPPEPLPVVVAGVSQHLLLIRHHLSLWNQRCIKLTNPCITWTHDTHKPGHPSFLQCSPVSSGWNVRFAGRGEELCWTETEGRPGLKLARNKAADSATCWNNVI